MMLYRLNDVDPMECTRGRYDAVFFASGYEKRTTHVARMLERDSSGSVVVLGFDTWVDEPQRVANDAYFDEAWKSRPRVISANDDTPIYELCRAISPTSRESVRILVDYSSMSRLWYAGLLNWARYLPGVQEVVIDFVYSFGRYTEDRPQMVIDDIVAIPGCEGGAMRISKSVAVFGLGFDQFATLCVLDRLEPDLVYSFLASPGSDATYLDRVRSCNEEIIQKHAKCTLDLPLGSVERTFCGLSELIAPHILESDVTLVPMGPKPHVLASILLSLRFIEVACLRVSGHGATPARVEATGEVIATRVHFRHQDDTANGRQS